MIAGSTILARFSFGNQPEGINKAVNNPHAIKAPIFGKTILVKNPPTAWMRARKDGVLALITFSMYNTLSSYQYL
ncbi:hypothetical protein APP_36580 [Aeribacillus pallidus]|nr:hypothetical protein APP_36580 [Aeribacillus pallidus]